MNKKIIAFIIFSSLIFSGCSSKIDIEGEVFHDINGQASKLANVEIKIFTEDVYINFIKSRIPLIQNEVNKINLEIELMQKKVDGDKSISKFMQGYYPGLNAHEQYIQKKTLEIDELKRSIEDFKTGKRSDFYYSENMPGSIAQTSTNSDGKYKIKVNYDKRAALVAAKGGKYWFLWVNPKTANNLSLTNSNSNDKNCEMCIFDGKTTPESL